MTRVVWADLHNPPGATNSLEDTLVGMQMGAGVLGRVLKRLRVPDPDPAVVAQGLREPDDAAVLRPPPQGHVSVQVHCDAHHAETTKI